MNLRGTAPRRLQSGVYIIAIGVLLGIAVTLLTFGLITDLTRSNISDQRTAKALEQAKQSLIGYAAAYRDRVPPSGARTNAFGFLPCPDMDGSGGEGVSATACGAQDVTMIGRLPWRTLDLAPLRDGSGECLWYALSGTFKNNPKTDLMNWDTNGLIEVMRPDGTTFVAGASPTNRAVAILFSPGAVLPGQDRSLAATNPPNVCRGNYNAANYLDTAVASAINNATAPSATANGLSRFIAALHSDRTAATNDSFNDRLAAISPDEIFARRINLRTDLDPLLTDPAAGMLRRLADCIVWYGKKNNAGADDKRLPWAVPITLSNYGVSTAYSDGANVFSGRFPYRAQSSDATTDNKSVVPPDYELLRLSGADACPNWGLSDEFWDNWKDHIFYAVAKAFAPNSAVATDADPCASDECISVDGVGGNAAVVIFTNIKATGQSRNNDANPLYTSAEKTNQANYLEGINATTILNNSPSVAAPREFSKLAGNDTTMCVRLDPNPAIGLWVDPTCNSAGACTTDSNLLAGYRSGNVNTCKVGKDSVLPACKTLKDKIDKNNCSCEDAAKKFVEKECITKGFTTSKCINAYNALLAC